MPFSAPALLAIALGLGLLVLLPARRLESAGLAARTIGMYVAAVWALAFFLALWPGMTRLLLPILLIAYLAPFVAGPERIGRISRMSRRGGRGDPPPPVKNVTPPDGPAGPP